MEHMVVEMGWLSKVCCGEELCVQTTHDSFRSARNAGTSCER